MYGENTNSYHSNPYVHSTIVLCDKFSWQAQLTCYSTISGYVTTGSHAIGPITTVQGNPTLFCEWGLVHETNFAHGTCIHMDLISGMESGPDKSEVRSLVYTCPDKMVCSYTHKFSWRAAAHMLTNRLQ